MGSLIYLRSETLGEEDKITFLEVEPNRLEKVRINWIDALGEGFYEMGLTFIGKYPYAGLSTNWVFILDEVQGFAPLFDATKWSEEDLIHKGKRLLNNNLKED